MRFRVVLSPRVMFFLVFALVTLGGAQPIRAQDSVFQIIALNRLMVVVTDAMLPLTFDVPVPPGTQPLSAQVSDVWYCGGNQNNSALAVVVVLPVGVTLPKRIASQTDCNSRTLSSAMSGLRALNPRPSDWMAAAFISASYTPGKINLTFVNAQSDVKPGTAMPPAIATALAQTTSPFRTLDTTNVSLTVQGKSQNFTLSFLFQPDVTTVFGFPQNATIPDTLALPNDVSLQNLPAATNCIFRVSHAQAKQQLSGPLVGLTFPLQAGGQTYTVSNFQINGSLNQYQTIGVISNGGTQLHPTINWAGTDLGFQNISLAEATASCSALDVACKARKVAATALQSVLSGLAPQGKPLRPVTSKDVEKFQVSGETFVLHLTVLRSSSTNDSLQLTNFLSMVKQ